MTDGLSIPLLAFVPVVREQEPAAPFGKPIDAAGGSVIPSLLQEALVAEAEKICMELAAATEREGASNLTGVMPAPVTERFEHHALQLAALSHKAILAELVSTFLFVTEMHRKARRVGEVAKASTLQTGSRTRILILLFPHFLCKRFVSNVRRIQLVKTPRTRRV